MKLSVRLFDADESAYLAKVIELASRRARVAITPSSASQADVIFLCAGEPGAQALLNARDQQRIIVVYGGDPDCHRWTLPRPATSQNLVPLLDRIHRSLDRQQNPESLAGNDDSSSALFPARHGHHMLEHLQALNAAGQPWQCSLAPDLHFIVEPASQRVHASADLAAQPALLASLAVRQPNPQFTRLTPDDLQARRSTLRSLNLETFCWLLASKAEPQHQNNLPLLQRRFRLKRWPGFSRLPHTPAQISLTGRLMRQSLSLQELASDARISPQAIAEFYNCVSACGLVEFDDSRSPSAPPPAPQAEPHPAGEAGRKRGLFSRILRSLTGQQGVAQPVL